MKFHRQAKVPGYQFKVDAGVLDLIIALNKTPGMRTEFSRQGYPDLAENGMLDGPDKGWVSVHGEAVYGFISFLADQHVPFTVQLSSPPASANLYWEPCDYEDILRCAQVFEASRRHRLTPP